MIIESLLEYYKVTKNIDVLTEYVRHNLSETIKKLYEDHNGVIHAIAIDPQIEESMTRALTAGQNATASPTLGLPPDTVNKINESVSETIDEVTLAGHLPLVICSAQIRPYFHRMIHSTYPMINVISYTELPADTDIEIHARIQL
jgi:flagellar biosynthesis protein FlhA